MRKYLLVPLAVSLLFLSSVYAQERAGGQLSPRAGHPREETDACADRSGQSSATHQFRQMGETIEIPLRGDSVPTNLADCEPVALDLHWINGRNNGSNFNVTFLDGNNRPIYAKHITAFMTGVLQFPLSSFDAQPMLGSSLEMISIPITVTIQAVRPFAAPANLSYRVTRVPRSPTRRDDNEERQKGETAEAQNAEDSRAGHSKDAGPNEIVSIHNAVRLIGSSRLPVVQIELKTSRPFPVKDVPLQLQIGKKVFVDELSGDYTGRKLTLSLTPEMFAELKHGDEIVAFFTQPDQKEGDVWRFGKLNKSSGVKQ
ncbi:MAG: hypothetical protein ABI923_04275 [bacterium]